MRISATFSTHNGLVFLFYDLRTIETKRLYLRNASADSERLQAKIANF